MKNNLLTLAIFVSQFISAQMYSRFESFNLPDNSYLDGSTSPLGTIFNDEIAHYYNYYESDFGGYWASGWAISTMTDNTTAGFSNLFSAIAGSGHNSRTYGVGQQNAGMRILNEGIPQLDEVYITNSTYAALSMRDGDQFAKKFGGATGNDPDYFRLIIRGYQLGVQKPDSVIFYLADYRFEDNSLDYIVTDWQSVNLLPLGFVDSLNFELQSSDMGEFGMNTPAFFCMDDLYSSIVCIGLKEETTSVNVVFPNPFQEEFSVRLNDNCEEINATVHTIDGQLVLATTINRLNNTVSTSNWKSGCYILSWKEGNTIFQQRIVKQ